MKRKRPGKLNPAVEPKRVPETLYGGNDLAEHVADGGTKDGQNDDDHNGNQHKDESIFHQALALLLHLPEHLIHLLSWKNGFPSAE
jgi:hypothetical protein